MAKLSSNNVHSLDIHFLYPCSRTTSAVVGGAYELQRHDIPAIVAATSESGTTLAVVVADSSSAVIAGADSSAVAMGNDGFTKMTKPDAPDADLVTPIDVE